MSSTKTLKQKTISGMIWNGLERFGSSLFLFISNLVLARLLSPEDFGAIGMLMVFISLSQIFIDGGFGTALIQKKEPTQTDYSTIFFWNIFLSVLMYVTIYFSAPVIAIFYKMPELIGLLRVLGVILIINAFFLIQDNILKKCLNFKKTALINLIAIVLGTIVGIIVAYKGYGVWSLIVKTITTSVIQCILFWYQGKWIPSFVFCYDSFKSLFKFGGFMFLNTLVSSLYFNLLNLIIGKSFSSYSLGLFNQARKLEDIPRNTLATVINNVSLPVLSQYQDNAEILKSTSKKIIKHIAFLNFPLMTILFIIAEPMIIFLFTDKWAESIPIFKILCTQGAIYFMFEINSCILLSLGKSKLFFKIRIFQAIVALLLIVLGSHLGLNYVVIGYSLSAYICFILISIISGKILNYGLLKQIKDITPFFIISLISGLFTYSVSIILAEISYIYITIIQVILFCIIYITMSYFLKIINFQSFLGFIKSNKQTS